jgi:rod shape-determining protein MreC
VEEVGLKNAKINLLSNPSSSVNVVDLETGAKGIVSGEYGLGLAMDMVAQTDALNEGETIVTSGLGGGIPRGLLVGKIKDLRSSGDKLFQQASIVPRVKYATLEVVFVIKNK